jgi:hypothetical protein
VDVIVVVEVELDWVEEGEEEVGSVVLPTTAGNPEYPGMRIVELSEIPLWVPTKVKPVGSVALLVLGEEGLAEVGLVELIFVALGLGFFVLVDVDIERGAELETGVDKVETDGSGVGG